MGHWYDKDGAPQHFTNGRDTTLRDARKHGYFPSVTTIIGILDKPALTNWKMKQVLLASLTLPAIDNEPPDAFAARIMRDAFEGSTDARDRGSEIHDCLEAIAGGLPKKYPADIQAISNEAWGVIVEYCETSRFTAEQTVVGDGFAGMVDLYNDDFVIDWKTKDIKDSDTGKKLAYPEMCMQLSAYAMALPGGKQRRLINAFIDRTSGKTLIHEWTEDEKLRSWQQFALLVKYWQLSKNYYPDLLALPAPGVE